MAGLAFNRGSLRFAARRLERGIQLAADFDAPKLSTGEPGSYSVSMLVDPQTRGIIGRPHFHLRREGAEYRAAHGGGLDDLRKFAYEIRDIFLKSAAWAILEDRQPDLDFSVDEGGRTKIRTRITSRP